MKNDLTAITINTGNRQPVIRRDIKPSKVHNAVEENRFLTEEQQLDKDFNALLEAVERGKG